MATIEKMIIHQIDLKMEEPVLFNKVMDLQSIPNEALEFFSLHISNALFAKQIKTCIFTHENAAILIDCCEIASNFTDDEVFISNTQNMTHSLFNTMKSTSTKSSGTLIFIVYSLKDKKYLAIMKMDPNNGIQVDLKSYKLKVQKDMLPSVNEKLHKCAFIELDPNLWEKEIHLRVLDKQQVTGEVSKYFLSSFLESKPVMDNQMMTELVSENLRGFVVSEKIVSSPTEILEFNAKVEHLLNNGNEIDLERDLESLFKTYVKGEADRLHKIESFKQKIVAANPNAYFEFVAEKSPTVATYADQDKKIKIQFPLGYVDTTVFVTYEKEDGETSTIIKIKGKELIAKYK
ncbi:nucleoid-associated protein [Brevibacillus sp. NPDC003359]|uniref:nucleoid-associated protein n=1 Tax=unclassified Brevibacillus TaxID=2684853 RepID=UPI003679EAA3